MGRTPTMKGCIVCGFVSDADPLSVEYAEQHRIAHLAAFPGLDPRTRQALDMIVEYAQDREIARATRRRAVLAC